MTNIERIKDCIRDNGRYGMDELLQRLSKNLCAECMEKVQAMQSRREKK